MGALIRAQLEADRREAAVVSARRLVEAEGGSAHAQLWLALALGAVGDGEEGRKLLADSLQAPWTSVRLRKLQVDAALALGDIQTARAAVEQAATLQSPPTASVIALGARVSMAEGSFDRADREVGNAFKRDDKSPEVAVAML
jgi:Flp pilus assembly protein TadD